MGMKKKSVGKNAVLNMIKTIVSLIFPLITFPYISRVLEVENLGKVNFVNSIVAYFVLFATLGVKTYGVREGAAIRDNSKEFQKFFSELFTITIMTTILSLIGLLITVVLVPSLWGYRYLFAVLSISIFLPTLGTEWVCSVYEDYGYITIRSILIQLISFIIIFLIIHKPDDYYKYACILVFSSQGANIFNFFYVRKYVRIKFRISSLFGKHVKTMLIMFASALATSVYVNSDMTVLGMICGEYYTGLYGSSTKLYSVLKNLISAIVVVSIPRFSYYYRNEMSEEYDTLLYRISNILVLFVLPIVFGVFILSEEITIFISGYSYIQATSSLRILSLAICGVAASWVLSQCVLIPRKKEKIILYTTVFTAVLNVVLNILFVDIWKHNATAFTTLLSEVLVAGIYFYHAKSVISIRKIYSSIKQGLIGCTAMTIFLFLSKYFNYNVMIKLPIVVIISALIYYCALMVQKNEFIFEMQKKVKQKIMRANK